jgi:branched-chain amino acid:cation transporter, LIVCS family
MKRFLKSAVIPTGLAMFTMFFGAGNVVFPLALGRFAGDKNIFAILGLLITAVGVPFLGLFGMILFDGNYKKFFSRLGRVPGFLLIALVVAVLGPFGAMSRCVTLSHSAIKLFYPGISLFIFSLIAVIIIFLFSIKENKILDVLGRVLGPLLVILLAIIIIKGILVSPGITPTSLSGLKMFLKGLSVGYDTMDLLAAGFFSAIVIATLKSKLRVESKVDAKKLSTIALKASVLGASLLGIIYVGLSFASAFHATSLQNVGRDFLLSALAYNISGYTFGVVASVAVAIACLTTAIALAAVFADFLRFEICRGKLGYVSALLITMFITIIFSNFGFEGLMKIIHPFVSVAYPAIITLTILNIANKLFGFKIVKVPVAIVFLVSLIGYFL